MSGRRVRSTQRKEYLASVLFNQLSLKFTQIIPTGECFIIVCLTDDDVDTMIAAKGVDTLRSKKLKTIIPSHFRAKKSIIVKGLDKEITKQSGDELKDEIEGKNPWAKVEEV